MRGVWPSISDLVRRGVVPWVLRRAVMDAFGKKSEDLTFEDVAANTEQRLRIAASFIRAMLDDESEDWEWEPLEVSFERLTSGDFPGDDVEALDGFVFLASTEYSPEEAARLTTQSSEVELGLFRIEDFRKRREPAEAVSNWTQFRDGDRGSDGDTDGAGVEPAPLAVVADHRPKARTGTRRRASSKAEPRAATG